MTTTIDVQPSLYYTAASALHTAAADLFGEVQGKWGALSGCASMAGSYDEAKTWATSYDAQTNQALDAATTLAETMDAYAGALREIGHNHEMADWNATTGTKGAAPTKPADPIPAVTVCQVPPPSAGGPGNGLTDAIHLAEKVGIIIPDGDTEKLGAVGDAWAALATVNAVSGLSDELGRIINSISLIKSPEADTVLDDLRGMQTAATTLTDGFGNLAKACHSHKTDLVNLRSKLEKQLEDLAKELAEQEAINLAIGVAASFVTFGVGAVVAAARSAELVAKFARPIREMVELWKEERAAKKELDGGETLAAQVKKQRDLQKRLDKAAAQAKKDEEKAAKAGKGNGASTKPASLTYDEEVRLNRGPTDRNGKDLISAIREDAAGGKKLTPEQQEDIAAYNKALDKLPAYEGKVVRHTTLTREQLDKYVANEPITEDGYTCTSNDLRGTNGGLNVGTNDVEYRMTSKTGRAIGKYGGTQDEIQFKDHTQFFVRRKYWDDSLKRTIIYMDEM